jgi:hypothetical protein
VREPAATNGAPPAAPEPEVEVEPVVEPEPVVEAEPEAEVEPVHVSEEPELVMEASEPGAEEEPGPEIHVEPPWEGYDRMKAAEIDQRLQDASDELAAVVRLYELGHKRRQTVIRAAERSLRS